MASASLELALISIEGDGEVFCGGADLGEVLVAAGNDEASEAYCADVGAALMSIDHSPLPTVAAVRGGCGWRRLRDRSRG
jgi:enoyl-CoA hydratase/carnithine racemase